MAQAPKDSGCIAELLRRYEPMLAKMAATFGTLGYEDCMQEGGIALVDAVLHYDATRGTRFATYAYVCVRNRLMRLLSKADNTSDWEVEATVSPMPSPEEAVLREEAIEESKALAKRLLSHFEYAVWRMRIDGYSYQEIAVALTNTKRNVDVKSVNNALTRVRKKLRGSHE